MAIYKLGAIEAIEAATLRTSAQASPRQPGDLTPWQSAIAENRRKNIYYHPPFQQLLDAEVAKLRRTTGSQP